MSSGPGVCGVAYEFRLDVLRNSATPPDRWFEEELWLTARVGPEKQVPVFLCTEFLHSKYNQETTLSRGMTQGHLGVIAEDMEAAIMNLLSAVTYV